jgi:hypothetical protein
MAADVGDGGSTLRTTYALTVVNFRSVSFSIGVLKMNAVEKHRFQI